MTTVHEGQCGLCQHFGEGSKVNIDKVIKIRKSHEADEDLVSSCGHPKNQQLHLKVTPISGCDGFSAAKEAHQ